MSSVFEREVATADRTTIGMSARRLIAAATSSPPVPGIIRSSRTRSGQPSSIVARASGPGSGDRHVEAVAPEAGAKELGQLGVVVDQQQAVTLGHGG